MSKFKSIPKFDYPLRDVKIELYVTRNDKNLIQTTLTWGKLASVGSAAQDTMIVPLARRTGSAVEAVIEYIRALGLTIAGSDNHDLTDDEKNEVMKFLVWYFWYRWSFNALGPNFQFRKIQFLEFQIPIGETMEVVRGVPTSTAQQIILATGTFGMELPDLPRINVWGFTKN